MSEFEKSAVSCESESTEYLTQLIDSEIEANEEFPRWGRHSTMIRILLTGSSMGGAIDIDKAKNVIDNLLRERNKEEAKVQYEDLQNITSKAREALSKNIIKNEQLRSVVERKLLPLELLVASYATDFLE